ncbi:MAG: SDR family NAD(P)-dependent oxidoreductase [Pirellulaceae bacterium]
MSGWANKVVAVTGGSAGLGRAIARAFRNRGATVALIARDEKRLQAAASHLGGDQVLTSVADVADENQAKAVISDIIERAGRLDVLVNNVGKSVRIELAKATPDDYRQYMEINFLSAVHCTNAALDALTESSGHIVNIGSLSSKTAWPFLAPYTTSKFALGAFTHHLRLEGPSNVHYMLVCPGPLKREDAGERYNEQASELPDSARKPAAGARVRGLEPSLVAEKIVRGCEKRKLEWLPWRLRLGYVALSMSPRLGDWIIRRKMTK